jgi:hypothetical protein
MQDSTEEQPTIVTPEGVRDGDPAALSGLTTRRGSAVLAYAERVAAPGEATDAAAEAFAWFRRAVVEADDPYAVDPERTLLRGARYTAASRAPRVLPLRARLRSGAAPCELVPELLAARAERELGEADLTRLARHLERCDPCRTAEDRFRVGERAYRDAPDEPPPPFASRAIMAALLTAAPNAHAAEPAAAAQPAAPAPPATAAEPNPPATASEPTAPTPPATASEPSAPASAAEPAPPAPDEAPPVPRHTATPAVVSVDLDEERYEHETVDGGEYRAGRLSQADDDLLGHTVPFTPLDVIDAAPDVLGHATAATLLADPILEPTAHFTDERQPTYEFDALPAEAFDLYPQDQPRRRRSPVAVLGLLILVVVVIAALAVTGIAVSDALNN